MCSPFPSDPAASPTPKARIGFYMDGGQNRIPQNI